MYFCVCAADLDPDTCLLDYQDEEDTTDQYQFPSGTTR